MAKSSKHQEQEIGGFDETYMNNLNPEDPDFVEKFIESVKRPIEIVKDEK
ncbi:hypothetical protein PAECIP111891_02722 [Paenibacillus allorhizoplanae]|uniref:YfhD family protein n=1 Tax=Paenibacillus allorhizoplanae TaxID=2905648 RepID=A0ABM9C6G6_9BACL|nr:hypothetical protein PAECIP111891_02722 [Paenibacillus allorhizoplanae]